MAKAINELLESDLLDEQTKATISEAFDAKIAEAREEIAGELREEFATRYDNDKSNLVEAMDNMLQETIKAEISEFVSDRNALVEERIAYKKAVAEHSDLLSKFVTKTLAEEVKELRSDRDNLNRGFETMEGFVVDKLAEEIKEFAEDKRSLAEAKVKLVAEGRKKIQEAKDKFIAKGAEKVENTIGKVLKTEMSQLKEDIKTARENNFGRKIFEAMASEYMTSYLAEGTEVRKLKAAVDKAEESAKTAVAEAEKIQKEKKIVESKMERTNKLTELTSSLSKEKKRIMIELLEGVDTSKLDSSFKKYLPAVLNEGTAGEETSTKKVALKEHTGDKVVTKSVEDTAVIDGDINNIVKLAGIKK